MLRYSGVIVDQVGDPIVGAIIYAIHTGEHDHTDDLGRFELDNVTLGDSLRIQAIGYTTRQIVAIRNSVGSTQVFNLEPLNVALDQILVRPEIDATSSIAAVDIATRPATNSQELLRTVPGLVIGQHAGGGKAEQIFFRGFDVDHGTDVAIDFDGQPVNMVSHAHGQGYADLHFIIPETVNKITFTKGPYEKSRGNFGTAASISLSSKARLNQNLLRLEGGQFGLARFVAMATLSNGERQNTYGALEILRNNGPFESSQNFRRSNGFLKSTLKLRNNSRLILSGSHFTSTWTASGQIPERAVHSGRITRFGAIDDTEGGQTSRSNLNIVYTRPVGASGLLRAQAFVGHYDFELFSNFTFFLENPVAGDQIVQREDRWLAGSHISYHDRFQVGQRAFEYTAGIQSRNDWTEDSELSNTANRTETLTIVQIGDIKEGSYSGYASVQTDIGKIQADVGIRYDATRFMYKDASTLTEASSTVASTLNPSLRLRYTPNPSIQGFLKVGSGYHANDARLIVSGTANTFMPRAVGSDLGLIVKPLRQTLISATAWALLSQQEFVYVGDAGIVEPSGRSRRVGVDLGVRTQLAKHLSFGGNLSLAHARAVDELTGEDRIPLAPPMAAELFMLYQPIVGLHATLRARILANRPANEDYSITAKGYEVLDATVGYSWESLSLDLIVDNLFNVDWNETLFATESRLADELNPVEEIHFTPGSPRLLRARVSWNF